MKLSLDNVVIEDIKATDVRFPTSLGQHGSDAMHKDPDYSMVYIVLVTNEPALRGFGFSFTIGRGNEIVLQTVLALRHLVVGRTMGYITDQFSQFWFDLVNESQLRWLGPEKGVIHLAAGGIVNAIWDLWARIEEKPLWKHLVDMEPKKLISLLNFQYVEDYLTPEEALTILERGKLLKSNREKSILSTGYPAYVTSVGWLGYSDATIQAMCKTEYARGFRHFKMKVGSDLEDDKRRMALVRQTLGYDVTLMIDANQRWSVPTAIDWTLALAPYRPYWIEEPTSCDDVLGHADIARALTEAGKLDASKILVATGEHCHNRVMFKQFLRSGGMEICQVDSCRLAGINEVILVLLMAAKAGVAVCPHAGGVGLCEYVQHLIYFDFICLTGSLEGRFCEYADHLHEHFKQPAVIKNAAYMPPQAPGYSAELHEESLARFTYPTGPAWIDILQAKS